MLMSENRPGKKGPRPAAARASAPPPIVYSYSARQTTWFLLGDQAALTEHEHAYVAQLQQACPSIARPQTLALAFRELVHQHDLAAFADWLAEAD